MNAVQATRRVVAATIAGFLQSIQGSPMVVLRLARGGSKGRPFFNIVAADSRSRRDGRFIERLGFYNPIAAANEQGLRLAMERIEYWTGHGAQVSPTVQRLIAKFADSAAKASANA
jgi:small subunit ribosomal protein S16